VTPCGPSSSEYARANRIADFFKAVEQVIMAIVGLSVGNFDDEATFPVG